MLKGDAIYDSLFRFRDINFDNVNDIYFAISIIVIIATTLFKTLIAVIFIFKLVIIIIFNVDDIVIIIIIVFKKSVLKFIAFGFDIKKRFAMNASLDKS